MATTTSCRPCPRIWRAVWRISCILLLAVLSGCYSTSPTASNCRQPCINVTCPSVQLPCCYGNYSVCGGCCLQCRNGPGELCEGYEGPCGEGMECEGAFDGASVGLPGVLRPGRCRWIEEPSGNAIACQQLQLQQEGLSIFYKNLILLLLHFITTNY